MKGWKNQVVSTCLRPRVNLCKKHWQFSLQSDKVEFFPQIELSLFRFLPLLVASPPSVLTTLKKCRKMSRSLRTPLLQPRLNILSVRLYHRLEQDKSYRVWYWTLCRRETWAPTSWLLRCLLVTRAMGRMGSQEKEKLRIRTKKWSPQGLRARQTGTNTVRECILIPTTKVTTT